MSVLLNQTLLDARLEGSTLWDYSGCNHHRPVDVYECSSIVLDDINDIND